LMASFERVYPVRLSSLCRHLVGTGRVTSTDEKDELVEYSSWYGVVYCVLMFELLLSGQLFRRRVLCREEQLLLTFSRRGLASWSWTGWVSRFRAQNRTVDHFSKCRLSA